MHTMAASFTSIEELEIDKADAEKMSNAIADVASHYNATIDPKTLAWFGFAMTMGGIYGPRVASYKMRKKLEKTVKQTMEPQRPSADIVGITSANVPIANIS